MEFIPRKNTQALWLFYLIFGIFFVIGLVILSGALNGTGNITVMKVSLFGLRPERIFGLVSTLFPLLVLSVLTVKSRGYGRYYRVAENGVEVGMGILSKPRTILFIDMLGVSVVGHEIVEKRMAEVYESSYNFRGGIGAIATGMINFADILMYTTEAIIIDSSSYRRTGKVDVSTAGEFVMIEISGGHTYFLSPVDVQGLKNFIDEKRN